MELKPLKFDLPLTREYDAVEYWNDYYKEQKALRDANENLNKQQANQLRNSPSQISTTSGNTDSNQTPGGPQDSATVNPTKLKETNEQLKKLKKENVSLRVQLEKIQIEKDKLSKEVKNYETQMQDLKIELQTYKNAVGPSKEDVLPILKDSELEEIRQKVENQNMDDQNWKDSSIILSNTLNKIQNDLKMLTESEISFLTNHVPTVDPNTLIQEENIQIETKEENNVANIEENENLDENITEQPNIEENNNNESV